MNTPEVNLKCPYCRHVFRYGEDPAHPRSWSTACPRCGKQVFFPKSLRPAVKRRPRPRERLYMDKTAAAQGGVPQFMAALPRRPRYLAGILIVTALLSALLLPRANRPAPGGPREPTKAERTLVNLQVLRTALEIFRFDCDRYPTTAETLKALVYDTGEERWQGPYIDALKPDAWFNPYVYACTNDEIRLLSCGPDGIANTADDLVSPPPDPRLFPDEASTNATWIPIP